MNSCEGGNVIPENKSEIKDSAKPARIEEEFNERFFQNVSRVLENAQKQAKTAVNLTMVYAYFEIGQMIV